MYPTRRGFLKEVTGEDPDVVDNLPVVADLDRRAARARSLARESDTSAAILEFAAGLYHAQSRAAAELERERASLTGRFDEDAPRFLEPARAVLRYASESAPEPTSALARTRVAESDLEARARLSAFWDGDVTGAEEYLSRAALRPYVEVLRCAAIVPARALHRGGCPICGTPPWISARKGGSPLEGARRTFGCGLCGCEWVFGRILCPWCFEADPRRLPAFSSDAHPAVRIEACEACRRYLKSIDLSEDARPIPEVDDLVSLSMDLWAKAQGFERIEPGLAGV